MNKLQEILAIEIKNFIDKAFLFISLMQEKYQINNSPFKETVKFKGLIPMTGNVIYNNYKIEYAFHGNGCECVYPNERIVNFNFIEPSWDYDGRISLYNIWVFVKNNVNEFENKEVLEECFQFLEDENILIPINNHNTNVKLVNAPQMDKPRFKTYKFNT